HFEQRHERGCRARGRYGNRCHLKPPPPFAALTRGSRRLRRLVTERSERVLGAREACSGGRYSLASLTARFTRRSLGGASRRPSFAPPLFIHRESFAFPSRRALCARRRQEPPRTATAARVRGSHRCHHG